MSADYRGFQVPCAAGGRRGEDQARGPERALQPKPVRRNQGASLSAGRFQQTKLPLRMGYTPVQWVHKQLEGLEERQRAREEKRRERSLRPKKMEAPCQTTMNL